MGEKFGGWFDPDAVNRKYDKKPASDKLDIKEVIEKTLGGLSRLKDDSEDWPEGHIFVGVGLEGIKVVVEPDDGSGGPKMAIPLCKLQMLCAHGIEEFIAPPSVIREMINTLVKLLFQLVVSDSDFKHGVMDMDVEVTRIDREQADGVIDKLKEIDDILKQFKKMGDSEDDPEEDE